jgi:type I secretion system LssB family ATPase
MLEKSPALADPIWECLTRILQFYRLQIDRGLIQAQVPVDWSGPLAISDLILIARHIGLETHTRAIVWSDLGSFNLPAVAVLPENELCLYVPREDGPPVLWDPQTHSESALPAGRDLVHIVTFEAIQSIDGEDEISGPSRRRFDWFRVPFWQHKRDYLDVMLATFFLNLFALATPIYTKNIYDRVVPNHAEETLLALTIGITIVFAFNFAFKIVRGHVLEVIAARLAVQLDADLMDHLLRLSSPAQKLTVGEKSNLFREVQGLRDFFAARLMPALLDLPFFLLFLFIIHMIAPGLLMVVVIGIVLMFAANLACSAQVNRTADRNFVETRRKNAVLVEFLAGAQSIRLFNALGSRLLIWRRLAERSAEAGQHSQHMIELAGDISLTITYLVNVFLVVAGVYEIQKGDLTVGGLVASSILVGRAIAPIMNLAMVVGRFRQSLDSLKVIDRIFSLPVEPKLHYDYHPQSQPPGRLQLEDVIFYHPDQVRPTLYHLSLSIMPGEKVGLIGRTGAGKSTVIKLLDGTIQPQAGLVLVDDKPLSAIHPAEWRSKLGIVPQESFFFSGTIRENILLGTYESVDEVWLQEVLQMSGLSALLAQAGYGLDFQVGESGLRLSGGQRQSIAIARALIRKPGLLLMDEPTNSMDNTLENHVKLALQNFTRDKTLILVTHRIPLVSMVDRLILIDGGRVAADGARDDILKMLSGEIKNA